MKHAVWIRHARSPVATVTRECAGLSGIAAHAESVAARYAKCVELTDTRIAEAAAAVVARGGISTRRVILVVADVAFGIARHRVATDAHRIRGVNLQARDVSFTRKPGTRSATTIGVDAAEITVDPTSFCRLAHHHTGRGVRRTQPAAAIAAATADRAVDAGAAVGASRHRLRAGAEGTRPRIADAAATIVVVCTRISGLDAERRRRAHAARAAERGTTLATGSTRIAFRLAGRTERGAGSGGATLTTTALAVGRACLVVGNALVAGANAVHAARRATVRVRGARASADRAHRRIGLAHSIGADPIAAIGARAARLAEDATRMTRVDSIAGVLSTAGDDHDQEAER
ncbi:MAG: hypothetical protein JWO36_2510 [Myxococcales bacterium]|nr:hypothetical protein [Myxococcales bacterium]